MPGISHPFVALVPRTMTKQELVQAVRIEIAGEVEAQLLYEAHAAATDDEVVTKVFSDIADEEKEHMGELLALLQYLDSEEADHMAEGVGEVEGMMKELGVDGVASDLMGSVIRNDEGTEKELDAGRNGDEVADPTYPSARRLVSRVNPPLSLNLRRAESMRAPPFSSARTA